MMKLDVHHMRKAFVKNRPLGRAGIAVGVFEDQDPIRRRAVVIVRAEVRMTFRDKDTPVFRGRQAGRCHDVRMLGEQLDRQTLVASLRGVTCLGNGRSALIRKAGQ